MSNNTVNNNSNGYASNNNFDGCPALMSDGRFLTNYKPNCEMNKRIEGTFNKNVPMSSWEYKYNLTNNADKVIGFGSHIQITAFSDNNSYETVGISKNQDFYPAKDFFRLKKDLT